MLLPHVFLTRYVCMYVCLQKKGRKGKAFSQINNAMLGTENEGVKIQRAMHNTYSPLIFGVFRIHDELFFISVCVVIVVEALKSNRPSGAAGICKLSYPKILSTSRPYQPTQAY